MTGGRGGGAGIGRGAIGGGATGRWTTGDGAGDGGEAGRGAAAVEGALRFAAALRLGAALFALPAAFRPAFFAAFAFRGAALRLLAPAPPRRLAAARFAPFLALAPAREAADRRFMAFAFAFAFVFPGRAAFLRPDRLDFDFDPVRAIEPPWMIDVHCL